MAAKGKAPSKGAFHSFSSRLFAIFAAWTLFVAILLIWNVRQHRAGLMDLASSYLKLSLERDLTFRYWGARHGGVYVPVDSEVQPSEHMAHVEERNILSPSGRKLTLVNPSYMQRLLNSFCEDRFGIVGRICGKRPLYPAKCRMLGNGGP